MYKRQKEPLADLYLGRLFQARGDSEQSQNYYESYLQDHPNDAAVLYELGSLAFSRGEYDKAVTWFYQWLGCENIMNKRALWSGKIAALEYGGNFSAALQEMELYLENYPHDEEAQKEYIFLKTRLCRILRKTACWIHCVNFRRGCCIKEYYTRYSCLNRSSELYLV